MSMYEVTTESGKIYQVETESPPATPKPASPPWMPAVRQAASLTTPLTSLLNVPAPSKTLPVAGGVLGGALGGVPGGVAGFETGTLVGRELQRGRDQAAGVPSTEPALTPRQVASDVVGVGAMTLGAMAPEIAIGLKAFPMAQMITTGIGAGVGDVFSQMVLGKKPDTQAAVMAGVQGAALTGLVSFGLKAAHAIPEFLRANSLRSQLRIGGMDVTKAVERTAFIKNVQQDVEQTIDHSGELATMKVKNVAKVDAENVVDTFYALSSENPSFRKAVMKAAAERGDTNLVEKFFPEIGFEGREIGGTRVRSSAGKLIEGLPPDVAQQVLDAKQQGKSGVERIMQQAGSLGHPPGVPVEMTGEEAHRLRGTLREIYRDAMDAHQPRTFTERNALRLYSEVKQSLLAADESLKEDFTRHYTLMEHYRRVESSLKGVDELEKRVEKFFGGSESQVAFEHLLDPQVYQQALDFARANHIAKVTGSMLWRVVRFAAMVPFYGAVTALRAGIRREIK